MFQPARGTKDFLPDEMLKRNWVQDNIRKVFEIYGYQPLGTPAFESWEMLKIKCGEDIVNQIYYFKDKSDRELGLRFEWTASLARVIASHRELNIPFKRYAIGPVWRYERPSETSRREFWQMDVDIVGVKDPISDAEVLAVAVNCLKQIGIKSFIIMLNDRRLLEALIYEAELSTENSLDVFRVIDKRKKIGDKQVIEELNKLGASEDASNRLLDLISLKGDSKQIIEKVRNTIINQPKGLEACSTLEKIVEYAEDFGIKSYIEVDLDLARGLDYYTGPIFEIFAKNYEHAGSIAGGGRYDNLVEVLGGEPTPMTGISMGIDRLVLLLEKMDIFHGLNLGSNVYVATASYSVIQEAVKIAQKLRTTGKKTDLNLMDRGLSKQLDYANKKGIENVVIVGERELKENCVSIRDMKTSIQKKIKIEDLIKEI